MRQQSKGGVQAKASVSGESWLVMSCLDVCMMYVLNRVVLAMMKAAVVLGTESNARMCGLLSMVRSALSLLRRPE